MQPARQGTLSFGGVKAPFGLSVETALDTLAGIDPAIAAHRRRLVKTTGDGFLVEFASVVGALQCAVDIQRALTERNRHCGGDHPLELRIGLHLGDVIVEGEDIYGDGVLETLTAADVAPGTFVRIPGDVMTGPLTNTISVTSRRFLNSANAVSGLEAVAQYLMDMRP